MKTGMFYLKEKRYEAQPVIAADFLKETGCFLGIGERWIMFSPTARSVS